MANWKKVIVSGSIAELAQVTASVGITGSFTGDGSGLTGVTPTFPALHDGGTSHDATKFFVNDGDNRFVSGAQIQDYIYGGISGDVSIAAGVASVVASVNSASKIDIDTHGDDAAHPNVLYFAGVGTSDTHEQLYATSEADFAIKYTSASRVVDIGNNVEIGGNDGTTGYLKSSKTTFNLLNDTSTTINIGGGASVIGIGNATSLTTVNDDLRVVGNLIIDGTTTTVNTDNLNVSDKFILVNSQSAHEALVAGAGDLDGGLIVQTSGSVAEGPIGTAIYFNGLTERWGITPSSSVAWNIGGATYAGDTHNVVTSFVANIAGAVPTKEPLGNNADNKVGQMFIDTSDTANGGLYIYLP